MTNNEFQIKLNNMFAKHPEIARSSPKSLNELMYVLRMESDVDYCINLIDDVSICIPSVKETFVSSKTLARKILSIEYEEIKYNGKYYPTIIVNLNKEKYVMSAIEGYIKALLNGKGYAFLCEKGYDLSKDEILSVLKEFDYMVCHLSSNPRITQFYYDIVAEKLEAMYL